MEKNSEISNNRHNGNTDNQGCIIQEFTSWAGAYIFFFRGGEGAQHPLNPETPLKTIDFADPGGALDPQQRFLPLYSVYMPLQKKLYSKRKNKTLNDYKYRKIGVKFNCHLLQIFNKTFQLHSSWKYRFKKITRQKNICIKT